MYIVLGSMYETMSISTGLYPNVELWNANKLHYFTLGIGQFFPYNLRIISAA